MKVKGVGEAKKRCSDDIEKDMNMSRSVVCEENEKNKTKWMFKCNSLNTRVAYKTCN